TSQVSRLQLLPLSRYQKSARANQRSLVDSTDGLFLTKKVENLERKKLEVPTALLELPNSTSYVVEQIVRKAIGT
ncbi:hypothetical protein Tco_0483256, partial [Tanacetum coccineum]